MPAEVPLDIWIDPICPWCWIGKAQLDRALEAAPGHPFRIAWHPFRLNPAMPPGGMAFGDYLEATFGSQQRAVAALQDAMQAAEAAGLQFDVTTISRIPATLDAHRLIHWAGLEGRQTPAVAALFRAHFREGRDIGAAAVLADLAAETGMDRTVVARLLASDADRETIAAADAEARARGIRAAPTFIVAGTHVVPGAQPAELWTGVIDELAGRNA